MKALDEAAVVYQVTLTKTDKLKKGELDKRLAETAERVRRRPAAFPVIAATSSDKGAGIAELRGELVAIAEGW